MPPSTRRQALARSHAAVPSDRDIAVAPEDTSADLFETADDGDDGDNGATDAYDEETTRDEEDLVDEADDEAIDADANLLSATQFPPPGLKEISSLASWTVSSAKPGNGVAALRSPDLGLFWQSDGPQPHILSVHFFKRVAIVHMRIYLDFGADESYTPTKIKFLAGMGAHDVLEFAEMSFERPQGWIDVDFGGVGPVEDDEEEEDVDEEGEAKEIDWSKRPVLSAFLVQVRILENHQNGKDTHLRAVQLFARDEVPARQQPSLPQLQRLSPRRAAVKASPAKERKAANNVRLAPFMMDPELR